MAPKTSLNETAVNRSGQRGNWGKRTMMVAWLVEFGWEAFVLEVYFPFLTRIPVSSDLQFKTTHGAKANLIMIIPAV